MVVRTVLFPRNSHFTFLTTLQGEWTLQNDNSGGDAHAYDFCEALYDTSAKCHNYLSSSSSVYEVCQREWLLNVLLKSQEKTFSLAHIFFFTSRCTLINSPKIRRRLTAAYVTLFRAWRRIIMTRMEKSTCRICTLISRNGQMFINTQRLSPLSKSLELLHPSLCFWAC